MTIWSQLRAASLLMIVCAATGCSDEPNGAADAGADSTSDASTVDVGGDADAAGGDADATDARGDADAPARVPIATAESWQPVAAADDPFDDAPDTVECDEAAYGAEEFEQGDDAFKVDTQGCNYLTVSQPAQVDVAAGDAIFVRLWHFDLTAPSDTQAHLAVASAEETIFEEFVPIPADSALFAETHIAAQNIAEGDELYFHLHNHGANQYYLLEVSLESDK